MLRMNPGVFAILEWEIEHLGERDGVSAPHSNERDSLSALSTVRVRLGALTQPRSPKRRNPARQLRHSAPLCLCPSLLRPAMYRPVKFPSSCIYTPVGKRYNK